MANQEQLEILKKGVFEWNVWRGNHLDVAVDLKEADLSRVDLSRVNFRATRTMSEGRAKD